VKKADIDARMADYLEGDLDLEDRALFDAFLDGNADSARELAELRRTISLLRSLPDPEPPRHLTRSVMERIRAGEARVPLWQRAVSQLSDWASAQWVVPLAAATTVVALAVLSGDLRLIERGREADELTRIEQKAARETVGRLERRSEAEVARREAVEEASRSEPLAPPSAPLGPASDPLRFARERDPLSLLTPEPELRRVLTPESSVPAMPVADAPGQPLPREFPAMAPGGGGSAYFMRAQGPLAASAVDEVASGEQTEATRNARLDDMMAALLENPDALVWFLADASLAERELWGKNLAQRAVELDQVDRALEALKADPRLSDGDLARTFGAEVRRLRGNVLAREGQGAEPAADEAAGR